MTSLAAPISAHPGPPPAMGAAIQTIGLVKRFGSRTAVDGLDLSIAPDLPAVGLGDPEAANCGHVRARKAKDRSPAAPVFVVQLIL